MTISPWFLLCCALAAGYYQFASPRYGDYPLLDRSREKLAFNKLIGRCCETDGVEAQNNRKDGDEYRANRDNLFVLVVNKDSGFGDAAVEDAHRRGAIFLIGMICFAAFAAFYWWLIAR